MKAAIGARFVPRMAALAGIVSAPLAFGCLVLGAAAVGFDLAVISEPAATLNGGSRGAELVRASMLLDLLGYYLLLAPGVVYLDGLLRERGVDRRLATLLTASGFGYLLIGALGASVLFSICPSLIRAYARTQGPERDAVALMFHTAVDAVHGGLWNLLEMILGAVFWGGVGIALRTVHPRFAALSLALGAAAAIDAIGVALGIVLLASIALPIYLLLAPIWALALARMAARDARLARPQGEWDIATPS